MGYSERNHTDNQFAVELVLVEESSDPIVSILFILFPPSKWGFEMVRDEVWWTAYNHGSNMSLQWLRGSITSTFSHVLAEILANTTENQNGG